MLTEKPGVNHVFPFPHWNDDEDVKAKNRSVGLRLHISTCFHRLVSAEERHTPVNAALIKRETLEVNVNSLYPSC